MSAAPLVIPLAAVNAQVLDVTLGQQACRLRVYTKHLQVAVSPPRTIFPTEPPTYTPADPIFLDLYVNDALILGGALCLTDVRIVRDTYLGFIGDLAFTDLTGGAADPEVAGLGVRWPLLYWPDLP